MVRQGGVVGAFGHRYLAAGFAIAALALLAAPAAALPACPAPELHRLPAELGGSAGADAYVASQVGATARFERESIGGWRLAAIGVPDGARTFCRRVRLDIDGDGAADIEIEWLRAIEWRGDGTGRRLGPVRGAARFVGEAGVRGRKVADFGVPIAQPVRLPPLPPKQRRAVAAVRGDGGADAIRLHLEFLAADGGSIGRAVWIRHADRTWTVAGAAIDDADVRRHGLIDGPAAGAGRLVYARDGNADDTPDEFFALSFAAGEFTGAHYHRATHHPLGAVNRRQAAVPALAE